MSAHTPGPWHFSGAGSITDDSPERKVIAKLLLSDGALYSNSPEMPDAVLIASAPTLLAERDALKAQNAELIRERDTLAMQIRALLTDLDKAAAILAKTEGSAK